MNLEDFVNKLHKWHQTKIGFLSFCVIELAMAYGFFSLALNKGNLWWWIVTIILTIGGLKNFCKLIESFIHGVFKKSSAR